MDARILTVVIDADSRKAAVELKLFGAAERTDKVSPKGKRAKAELDPKRSAFRPGQRAIL